MKRAPRQSARAKKRHEQFARGSKIGRYAIGGFACARRRRLAAKEHAAR